MDQRLDVDWGLLRPRPDRADDLVMRTGKRFAQLKPVVKRLIVAGIMATPLVALTNNLSKERVPTVKREKLKAELEVHQSFFDRRCLGIKPPAP